MKFTEFKQSQEVQLTEEQEIIISYCEGSITKKDAVSQLLEWDWRDVANKLTWGAIDSRAEQDAQDKAGYSISDTFAMPGPASKATKAKRAAAAKRGIKSSSDALASAPGASPASAIKSLTGLDIGAKKAQAAPPKDPKPGFNIDPIPKIKDPKPGYNIDPIIPKTGAAPAVKNKERPPVKATAANTRDYDKTLALQKKLIAQGAKIEADGLMGPKTRAAMKAAGMSTSTPGSKVKQPGPSVKQNPEYSKTGMDDVDMPKAKPKIRTDMPGGPTRLNAFKSVYNKASPAQKAAMIARLRKAQVDRAGAEIDAVPAPKIPGGKKKPVKKNFLGGDRPIFQVDDPKGGEVIARLPKWLGGGEVKTLPQQRDDSSGQ